MARYTSPPGTFEPILKSVLEDPSLTDAEFRLVCYLATKTPGWIVHRKHLARELGKSERHWVVPALKGLRERGLVVTVDERDGRGRITKRSTTLHHGLVVAATRRNGTKAQVSSTVTDSVTVDSTSGNAAKAQVSSTVTDHVTDVNRTPREDVPSSEDGQSHSEVPLASLAARAAENAAPGDAHRLDRLDALLEALNADGDEVTLAYGMASDGKHDQRIVNAILNQRIEQDAADAEAAEEYRQRNPPTTDDPWADPIPQGA